MKIADVMSAKRPDVMVVVRDIKSKRLLDAEKYGDFELADFDLEDGPLEANGERRWVIVLFADTWEKEERHDHHQI